MKPLTLVPPAQAEALYDADEPILIGDRFALMPWLDDDCAEDDSRKKTAMVSDQTKQNRLFAHLPVS